MDTRNTIVSAVHARLHASGMTAQDILAADMDGTLVDEVVAARLALDWDERDLCGYRLKIARGIAHVIARQCAAMLPSPDTDTDGYTAGDEDIATAGDEDIATAGDYVYVLATADTDTDTDTH